MAKRKLPTQRVLEYLRKEYPDIYVDKVERWIPDRRATTPGQEGNARPGGGVRKDLFGIIDLIAIRDNRIVGIQCSGYTAIKEHVDKIESAPATIPWLLAGGLIEVWAFKKTKEGNVNRYTPKVVTVTIPHSAEPQKPKPVTELF